MRNGKSKRRKERGIRKGKRVKGGQKERKRERWTGRKMDGKRKIKNRHREKDR